MQPKSGAPVHCSQQHSATARNRFFPRFARRCCLLRANGDRFSAVVAAVFMFPEATARQFARTPNTPNVIAARRSRLRTNQLWPRDEWRRAARLEYGKSLRKLCRIESFLHAFPPPRAAPRIWMRAAGAGRQEKKRFALLSALTWFRCLHSYSTRLFYMHHCALRRHAQRKRTTTSGLTSESAQLTLALIRQIRLIKLSD